MQISLAKGKVPFLMDEESKVLEFWQIWSESIPPREELQVGTGIEFVVSTSANMEKLTWRTGLFFIFYFSPLLFFSLVLVFFLSSISFSFINFLFHSRSPKHLHPKNG